MKSRLFVLPLLALALPVSTQAQPTYKSYAPADFQVPRDEMQKWAERLKQSCPPTGWTVKVEGNDILIARENPVTFNQRMSNQYTGEEKIGPRFERIYRIRLRFEPFMRVTLAKKLNEENESKERERVRLLQKYELNDVFGELESFGTKEEVQARQQAYLAESKKLVFYRLPDLYSTEYPLSDPDLDDYPPPNWKPMNYSVSLYFSWYWFQRLNNDDKNIDAECKKVYHSVISPFMEYRGQGTPQGQSLTDNQVEYAK